MGKDEAEKKEPLKRDDQAPEKLEITFTDPKTGKVWAEETAFAKHFSSGSVGFFAGSKLTNPANGEKYQMGCNIILIGSKPPQD